jgi:hypothetical protein
MCGVAKRENRYENLIENIGRPRDQKERFQSTDRQPAGNDGPFLSISTFILPAQRKANAEKEIKL